MNSPITPSAWGIQLSRLWLDCGQSFPVKVKEIALEVTKNRFENEPISIIKPHGVQGIDGMLSKRIKRGDWCISYDETVTIPGRINFTLGHEFGHYLLHRSLKHEFMCNQSGILDHNNASSKKIEYEANLFASYLLMPIMDFRKQIEGHSVSLELLQHCADRYETSFTATALKWVEFTEEAALLVMADSEDFVHWSYPSKSAKKLNCYIPPGTLLPETVINQANGAASQNKSRRVNSGVWHQTLEAEELSIFSDRFEMVIFLILFPLANTIEHEEEKEHDVLSFLSRDMNRKKEW